MPYGAQSAALSGNYAFVTTGSLEGDSLEVVDITLPETASIVARLEMTPSAGLTVRDGLRVYDITTPSQPVDLGCYLLDHAFDITVNEGIAYLAGRYLPGLEVFDITHGCVPGTLGGAQTSEFALSVDARDGLLVLLCGQCVRSHHTEHSRQHHGCGSPV